MTEKIPRLSPDHFDAVLFDMDGVLTATAKIHAASWKKLFDSFLQERASSQNLPFTPFTIDSDYRKYVDGKPRLDGIRDFLRSRDIRLPEGSPEDPPGEETVWSLGERKNRFLNEALATQGVEVYEDTVTLVRELRKQGIKTAVVTSSHNCETILRSAGITELFESRIDGVIADRFRLRGKPAPDTYLKAAEQLGADPRRTAIVEDAISGVQAGRAGGFGLVIGVSRGGDPEALRRNGADLVVTDMSEVPR